MRAGRVRVELVDAAVAVRVARKCVGNVEIQREAVDAAVAVRLLC